MKIKRLIGVITLGFVLSLQVAPVESSYLALANGSVPEPIVDQAVADYYVETFIISGYYSPLPNQSRYATGTYEGDIYLNGNGTNGADGTPVYPGMVACPRTRTLEDGTRAGYDFGTKFYIPGVGFTTCHDVGGAIVLAGERGNAHPRLDIWFGHGDEGLTRALNWGKRTVDVMVYGVNPSIQDEVYFNSYLAIEDFVQSTILSPLHFGEDLYYGSESEEVGELVNYLIEWGYYAGEPTSFYGPGVAQAVYNFQNDFGIVSEPEEMGAGHFGNKTRTQFDKLIKQEDAALETIRLQRGSVLLQSYDDLFESKSLFGASMGLGESGAQVTKLQEELVRMGLLYKTTGHYDTVTEHAVFKFQQKQGIVSSKADAGAGYVGPATRNALNAIIESRYEAKSLMAYERGSVESATATLALPNLYAILSDEE